MRKFVLLLASAALIASCAPKQTAKVDMWICPHSGNLKGVIINYGTQLDTASVAQDAFEVTGPAVTGYMTRDSLVVLGLEHPACGMEAHHGEGEECAADSTAKSDADSSAVEAPAAEPVVPDVYVKQVKPIKTADGKTLKPWKEAVKAE